MVQLSDQVSSEGQRDKEGTTSRRDSTASSKTSPVDVAESLKAKCTHHAPRKRLFTKLQALVTSPKRAYGHAERDGLGAIAGAFSGRHKRESISKEDSPHQTNYRERLASDASLHSPASGPLSPTSPAASPGTNFRHSQGNTSHFPSISSPQSPDAAYLTSSPVKREDMLYSPTAGQADQNHDSRTQTGIVSSEGKKAEASADASQHTAEDVNQPEVRLRPHLKLRIVTWNMHDSLPTGDLTELLGSPSAACSKAAVPIPHDPDHLVQPLSSGLDHDAPYHLVVVGGQEVPVGYGGWSGPNWTETIQKWLSGTTGMMPLSPAAEGASNLMPGEKRNGSVTSPSSPNAQHRQFLDAQSSETLVLPEDAVDISESSPAPINPATVQRGERDTQDEKDLGGQSGDAVNADTRYLKPESATHAHPTTGSASTAMGRSDSSDTTNTDRSVRTDMQSELSAEEIAKVENNPVQASAIQDELQSPYLLVTKERLMGIYCSLWVHRSCAHLVQGSSTGTVTAGLLAGKLGNKGAACISLKIVDTRFLFVCAHLAAHSEKSALRQANVKKIKEELIIDTFSEEHEAKEKPKLKRGMSVTRPFAEKDKSDKARPIPMSQDESAKNDNSRIQNDITDLFDHTFWFGDLNFRLDISRLHADFLIKEKKFDTALTFDQLQPILKDPNGCFRGFAEAAIQFAPSYKYDVLKLKRSKTIQRTGNVTTGLGLAVGDRRVATNQFASPTAPTSMNASRTNLAADVVDEEEEEGDNHSIGDRGTMASSRASISSTYSGFERSFNNDEGPDQETLANTNYNHRTSAGFFGSSIPSTPTTDKVIEKAKGFFHLMRARSPTNAGASEPDTKPSISLDTKGLQPETTQADLLSPPGAIPLADSEQRYRGNHSPRVQTPDTDSHSTTDAVRDDRTKYESARDQASSRQSIEMSHGDRTQITNLMRSTTPILSPRPRLKSVRSSNTVLSVSSAVFGKSMSSSVQEQHVYDSASQEATYDTSSKKRVQSWTDRILYKSTVAFPDQDEQHEVSRVHRSFISGTLISSLKSISKSGRDPQETQASHHTPDSTPPSVPDSPQRVLHESEVSPRHKAEAVSLYTGQNASALSLAPEQHGLNGRLAGLFRRRSSGNKGALQPNVSQDVKASCNRDVVSHVSPRSPASSATSSLLRSKSTNSPHQKPLALSTRAPEWISGQTSMQNSVHSSSSEPLSVVSRTKPHRAYTSPMPGTTSLPAIGEVAFSTDKQPQVGLPRDRRQAGNSPQTYSSENMSRHESEPLAKSQVGFASTVQRPSSEERLAKDAGSNDISAPKRSFPFSNPFTRSHLNNEHSSGAPVALQNRPDTDNNASPVKTGIALSQSKTTPVTSEAQATERPHLGLRQWWNARLLPHIFPFHTDTSTIDRSDAIAEADATDLQQAQTVPEPVIIGPRRGEIQCIYYNTISDLRRMEACSDHYPVVAVFAIGV